MELRDCFKFANDNPVCYLATMDGAQPRVRALLLWYADNTGFYFHTGPKAMTRQLQQNPRTEVCFYKPEPQPNPGTMMRVSGRVEFMDDLALKERLLEERPFMKQIVQGGASDPNLVVFRVVDGEAYFWTMASNMREQESPKFEY